MRAKLGYDLPGSLPNRGRPIIRTKCLRIAPTGRSFAAATTEGVLVYSVDESFIFDPTDLDIDVTPEVFHFLLIVSHSHSMLMVLKKNQLVSYGYLMGESMMTLVFNIYLNEG